MSRLVAITGATGFIGRALAGALVESGWQVRALTRREHTQDTRLQWVSGTLEDGEALSRLVAGTGAVIHCAGRVRGRSAQQFLKDNQLGTARVLEAAAREKPQPRFLLLSSLAAREPRLSWYASSKYLAERTLMEQAGTMPWTVFRPTAVYGPGDRELMPLFSLARRGILPVPGSASSRFSLIHIDDLVAAVLLWVSAGNALRGIHELDDGTPGGYDYRQLAAIGTEVWGRTVYTVPVPVTSLRIIAGINLLAASMFNYSPMLTPGKLREILHQDWICDNTSLQQSLGWRPVVRLPAALARMA